MVAMLFLYTFSIHSYHISKKLACNLQVFQREQGVLIMQSTTGDLLFTCALD